MKKLIRLIFIFTIVSRSLFAENKISIAVNDLIGDDINKSSISVLSNLVRSEFINSNIFRVLERSEMDMILKEQGFQQTGVCNDQECLVEVGQLLGVKNMVAGSVGKIGDMYTISIRMVDMSTGEITYNAVENCKCTVEKLASTAVPNVVNKLIKKIYPAYSPKENVIDNDTKLSSNKVKKHKQNTRRIVFSALTVVFAGSGLTCNRLARYNYNRYKDINSFEQKKLDESWDSAQRDIKFRNINYILSGLSLALFTISIPF